MDCCLKDQIQKKIYESLIKPYIYICLVCLLVGCLLDSFNILTGGGKSLIVKLIKNIVGICTGGDFPRVLISHSGAMWFVYSLILIKIFVNKVSSHRHYILVLLAICFMYIGNRMPFRIDSTLVGFIFFYIGYKWKNLFLRIASIKKVWLFGICVLSAISLVLMAEYSLKVGGRQGMSINVLYFGENPWTFLVSGILGTLMVFAIAQLLVPCYHHCFRFVSNGTIIILGFHYMVMHTFVGMMRSYNPIAALLFSLFILGVCCCFIAICNRHFPALIGYRGNKEKYNI